MSEKSKYLICQSDTHMQQWMGDKEGPLNSYFSEVARDWVVCVMLGQVLLNKEQVAEHCIFYQEKATTSTHPQKKKGDTLWGDIAWFRGQ